METPSRVRPSAKQAMADLYAEGVIGSLLLSGDYVPEEAIPKKNSWNDPIVTLDTEEATNLRDSLMTSSLFAPITGKPAAYPSEPRDLRQKISQINTRIICQHAKSRIWSPDMTYKLRPHIPAGGCLCVIKFRDSNGATSKPLILCAGPTGIARHGEILMRSQAFPSIDWTENATSVPRSSNGAHFPKGIAPMILTTEVPTREAIAKFQPAQRFWKLTEATSPLLVTDARKFGQCVCLRDWTGELSPAV